MKFTDSIYRLLFLLLIGFSLQACLTDHLLDVDTRAQLQRLSDSLYQERNAEWGIPNGGIILRTSNPAGTYLVSTNIEPAVQENSHFRIASISKTFTAAATMRLYQEGLIELDSSISNYLPDVPAYDLPYKNKITIRQLLQHRGGVFDVTNNDIPMTVNQPYAGKRYHLYVTDKDGLNQPTHTFTLEEMISVAAVNKLYQEVPDVKFHYSNTGYHVLAKIVELKKKMPFTEYITQTFFQPLGLNNTYGVYLGTDQRMKEPFLRSYMYVGAPDPIETWTANMSPFVADGNIVSTPADVSKWIEKLLTGQAGISMQNVEKMKEMRVADADHGVYGLGLTYNEGMGFGHDGFQLSYASTVRYDPKTQTTVLGLATFFKLADSTKNFKPEFLKVALGVQNTALRASQIAKP